MIFVRKYPFTSYAVKCPRGRHKIKTSLDLFACKSRLDTFLTNITPYVPRGAPGALLDTTFASCYRAV